MTDPFNTPSAPSRGSDAVEAVVATSRVDHVAEAAVAASREIPPRPSGQATAKAAVQILESRNEGYIEPTAMARRHVAMAFAGRGSVVYGKAFDVVRVKNGATVDWNDLTSVEQNLDNIVLYEVKSTNRTLPARRFWLHVSAKMRDGAPSASPRRERGTLALETLI